MDFKADLHTHSTFSDGSLSPRQLLHLAKEKQLSALSITDHDNINAYDNTLFEIAQTLNIELLAGVEISSSYKNETVHILGYNFDYHSNALKEFLNEAQQKRTNRNSQILEKLKKHNIFIDESFLKSKVLGRVHIAQEMIKKGYVKTIQEAFDKYLKDHGPCYVAGEKLIPEQIIQMLHSIKAKAVLAHPHQISKNNLILELLNLPFDGIEVYYGNKNPQLENYLLKIAIQRGLIITGGSDFHGDIKEHLPLGSRWTPKEYYERLKI